MRLFIPILIGLCAGACMFGPAVLLGMTFQQHRLQPIAIANSCAHYDATTGAFTWGIVIPPMTSGELDPKIRTLPLTKGGKHG